MSDLYLELRSRIPVVALRTTIGQARLQEAQDSVGLSNERLARLIPISEKTWRRWKEAGEVPTYALPRVAEALGLELVKPVRPLVDEPEELLRSGPLERVEAGLTRLLDGQVELLGQLAKIETRLDELEAHRPATRRAK